MTLQPPGVAPTVIGDYTLQTRLGEGGMGIVHLARHRDGRRVALKVLRPHIVGDEEARARLAREVSSLSRVRSPWVAEILDADPWADIPYVVTRYVPGLSLHYHVREDAGPVAGPDLLWLAGCLAEGIDAVHSAGVLHRDVKPANVLMEGRTPILIDFGLARVADDPRLTQTGWLLGTPGYLAPEILYGDDPTPAVDMHAWGATVTWAATGRAPYGSGPSMAIMDRTRRGEHDLSGMTGPLADVVAAALDPDPLARPTFTEVLAWLRPMTTAPDLPPVPPPVGEIDDQFTLPLAIANSGAALPPVVAEPAPVTEMGDHLGTAATRVEPPSPTRVLTEYGSSAPLMHAPPPMSTIGSPPAPGPVPPGEPALRAMDALEEQWDEQYLAAPVPWLERMRRHLLVVAAAVVIGAAIAAAPWVSAVVIAGCVWLLRSGSLAASAVAERRTLRGRRWYDGPRLLVTTPWHLLRGSTGTVLLLLWGAGVGVAAGLICYALHLSVPVSLLLSGTVFGISLWFGPGAGRFRRPLARVIHPAARRTVPWMLWCFGLGAVAAVFAFLAASGIVWLPAGSGPFGIE